VNTHQDVLAPKKVAIFAPYALIDRHAELEWCVARSLPKSIEIFMLRCNESFHEDCNAMHLSGINYESSSEFKREICSKCMARKKAWDKDSNYRIVNFSKSDFPKGLSDIETIPNLGIDKQINPKHFLYRGMPFGVYAAYDLLLANKSPNGKLEPDQHSAFLYRLYNVIGLYEYSLKFFASNRIDVLYVYDAQYSFNRAVVRAANDLGLRTVEISRSIFDSSQKATISMRTVSGEIQDIEFLNTIWPKKKAQPLGKTDLKLAERYVNEKFNPKSLWTYSHGSHQVTSKLREFLKKNFDKSHRLLIPLSSCDEQTAGFMNKGFVSEFGEIIDRMELQEQWLVELIRQLEEGLNGTFCAIIRIHPRMYSDNRTVVSSKYLSELEKKLNSLSDSFYIDSPSQKNGVMPLIGFSTVVMSQTSSVGLDAALFGRKLISFGTITSGSWPSECENRLNSSESLTSHLEEERTLEEKERIFDYAVKWLNLSFSDAFIPIENESSSSEFPVQGKVSKSKNRLESFLRRQIKGSIAFRVRSRIWARKKKTGKVLSKALIECNQMISEGLVNSSLEYAISEQEVLLRNNSELCASKDEVESMRRSFEARIDTVLQLALRD